MTVLYSIILAGGLGKRLWPISRELSPKQMLKLDSEYTLFQKTFLNLATIIDDKNIITTTNIKFISSIKEQLKIIQEKFSRKSEYKVLSEPIYKNTAPSVSMAVKYISESISYGYSEPVILVAPTDQIIQNREQYTSILEKGIKLAKEGYIVSFATETKEINENFGYIKARKNPKITAIEPEALKVTSFIEKPSKKEIKELNKNKIYVNSGLYMFTPSTYFQELRKNSPEIFNVINEISVKSTIPSINLKEYELFPDISIDYAIMEKCKKIAMINLNSNWKDIGSWDAIYEISEKDEDGNCIIGKTIDKDSKNSLIYSTSKLTATMGLKNKVVIVTEDAILVCDKNKTDNIKKLYKKLNGKNSKTKEIHKTVYRPWGYYTVLENGTGFLTKCITVNPNSKLSVQLHHHRSEHWIILEGEATVIKGNDKYKLQAGESIDIEIEEIHSLQNFGTEQLKVLEIQQGDILDENDIERLEDIYGRV